MKDLTSPTAADICAPFSPHDSHQSEHSCLPVRPHFSSPAPLHISA